MEHEVGNLHYVSRFHIDIEFRIHNDYKYLKPDTIWV